LFIEFFREFTKKHAKKEGIPVTKPKYAFYYPGIKYQYVLVLFIMECKVAFQSPEFQMFLKVAGSIPAMCAKF